MNQPWIYMCSPSWTPLPHPPHPIPWSWFLNQIIHLQVALDFLTSGKALIWWLLLSSSTHLTLTHWEPPNHTVRPALISEGRGWRCMAGRLQSHVTHSNHSENKLFIFLSQGNEDTQNTSILILHILELLTPNPKLLIYKLKKQHSVLEKAQLLNQLNLSSAPESSPYGW